MITVFDISQLLIKNLNFTYRKSLFNVDVTFLQITM